MRLTPYTATQPAFGMGVYKTDAPGRLRVELEGISFERVSWRQKLRLSAPSPTCVRRIRFLSNDASGAHRETLEQLKAAQEGTAAAINGQKREDAPELYAARAMAEKDFSEYQRVLFRTKPQD